MGDDESYIVGSYCGWCDERPSVEFCNKCGLDYCRACFDKHAADCRATPTQTVN